jgi:adenosylhomocysteine nucleosidase
VDVLLVTATLTEHRELQRAAAQFGLMVQERVGRLGLYYHFGQIGTNRVATMQVAMGAFGPQGSVSKCLQARAETRASTLMLVGTAFGIDPNGQRIGDVIVSDSVFMYDDRHARDGDELLGVAPLLDRIGRLVDHVSGDRWGLRGRARRFCGLGYVLEHPSARRPASAAWVDRFRALGANYHQLGEVERVTVGTILSGGALIESAHFRNELAALVPPTESPVLGGEMEALGALAAAKEDDDPGWIIVKSISDFADGATRAEEELGRNRETAARAAARAVLHALSSPANLPPETIDGEREQIS